MDWFNYDILCHMIYMFIRFLVLNGFNYMDMYNIFCSMDLIHRPEKQQKQNTLPESQ